MSLRVLDFIMNSDLLTIDAHPLLDARVFLANFPETMGQIATPARIREGLSLTASAPLTSDDSVRGHIRDLLRHGGYKPTGRGKPSSEYLLRAVGEGALGAINVGVDACNVVSLHSGLPISIIDLERAHEPLRIGIAPTGTKYVFNASGQEIDVGGLVCLFDADGPCANSVKDSQRTKTHAGTRETFIVVWGSVALGDRAEKAAAWYRELLEEAGAKTQVLR
jgi:DNA/RNA-binding domain of Phe-tRNA-synthetase-like protein